MINTRASLDVSRGLLRVGVIMFALVLFSSPLSGLAATPAPHLNGAGLVIEHGDGSALYFYVQFSEPQITGEQLLERSGVQLDITPYAGLGTGVCMIDHEGCPSSNCFCKSFAVPSVYWRYHSLNADGKWVFRSSGPAQRIVRDGDVDGWSWSSEDGHLPATSIDAIAKLNGIVRTPATAAPVATPTSAPIGQRSTATSSEMPSTARAAATSTPRVAGIAVSGNGQATPIEPTVASNNSTSSRNYLWFGAGVVVLLLAGGALALWRRIGPLR